MRITASYIGINLISQFTSTFWTFFCDAHEHIYYDVNGGDIFKVSLNSKLFLTWFLKLQNYDQRSTLCNGRILDQFYFDNTLPYILANRPCWRSGLLSKATLACSKGLKSKNSLILIDGTFKGPIFLYCLLCLPRNLVATGEIFKKIPQFLHLTFSGGHIFFAGPQILHRPWALIVPYWKILVCSWTSLYTSFEHNSLKCNWV